MFNYTEMFKRAIEYFPLWSDIRKRSEKSTGGRLLSSILEESINVESSIQDYINSYFLTNYIGHEDEVMAYVYMTEIGNINAKDFIVFYNNETFTFVDSIKDFENMERTCFYEEGKIYIKDNEYVKDVNSFILYDTITYDQSEYKIKRVHVWNIFDEFATFVNTRRYENETNKQLFDRILYITRNMPNGTEEGLKHAIVSELQFFVPEINIDEIKIERPTPENLIKPYEDYEALIDLLAEVNRDIYRTKRWDIDYWEYEFESISYIPHIWDKVVKDWQNGVGSYNDLEVILADNIQSTDASVHFYKKSLEAFKKYVYDKNIDKDINFTMTKYNDVLNQIHVKYKITASELQNITHEPIYLNIFESNKVNEEIAIQDIAVNIGKDIEKIDNSIIDVNDTNDYHLEFISKTGYDLKISEAKVIYMNKDTNIVEDTLDLLEECEGFVLNSEYELVSDSNKVALTAIEHFTTSEGFKNEYNYITIDDGYNEGIATYSLTNKGGLYINCNYECNTVKVPNSLIQCLGGFWNTDDRFVVRGDYSTEQKVLNFSLEANYVEFKINNELNGQISMLVEDESFGISNIDLTYLKSFESARTDKPRKITFTIKMISINDIEFYDFIYSNYSIELKTKYGSLPLTDSGYKLSNFYNNELTLTMSAKTGCSPIFYGLYIGKDFKNISYKTINIPSKANCFRKFSVKTNGSINLCSNHELIRENFKPITIYKATSNLSYLRINLSEYETIDKINLVSSEGNIERIEESGSIYYNIRLLTGQTVDFVKISGTRTKQAREISLEDMVKFYIKDYDSTYDSIFCSRCSKGLIIGRSNPGGDPYNLKVEISSDAFIGINAIKYVLNLPSHLGGVYGSNNGYENRALSNDRAFDYISIYPAGAEIYQALNSINIFSQITKYIPITKNFDKDIDLKKQLYYSVELFDKDMEDYITIKFHNDLDNDTNIYDLNDWSIGTANSYVIINNNINLSNSKSYNSETFNISEQIQVSSSVDIKDSYEITNYTVLNTECFIINTDEQGVSIKYDYFDGTSKKNHLLKYIEINTKNDGFNKLPHSNIDTIYHISKHPYTDNYLQDVTSYNLLKDEGLIIWNDPDLIKKSEKIYLVYSIKKPIAFVFDLDYLYKAIDYDVNAYEQTDTFNILNISNGTKINLLGDSNHTEISKSYINSSPDLVFVSCAEPTFEALLENNTIKFNKYTDKNTLLVKTGYYYINGREYYLFSETDEDDIKNSKYYEGYNIHFSSDEILTYKPTNNYISNSEMRLRGIGPLYNFNCKKDVDYGISDFDNLTSCESFNNWSTFEMKIRLIDGFNGLGLNFLPLNDEGYAYIDITDYLSDGINYVSFYATETLKVYLGKEESYLDVNFDEPVFISIDKEFEKNNSDIRYEIIEKNARRYYLIVQGYGTLDDIIISTSPDSIFKAHTKNITLLGLDLYEKKVEGSQYRMLLENRKDYTSYSANLMSNGYIKTTSNIDWYVTKIKSFVSDEDFKSCSLQNIGVNADCVFTLNNQGVLETQPIYIKDIDNIRRLIFKINDIELDNMTGFHTTILTSNKYNGQYITTISNTNKNNFHLNQGFFEDYIKIQIKIPPLKHINKIEIYADYYAENDNPLSINVKQSGYILSKVYDLQELLDCRVKSLDLNEISNINDVSIQIRCSRDEEFLDVWSDWSEIKLTSDLKIEKPIAFKNTRFLQFKILLKNRDAFIKISGINIEIN